MSPKRSTFCPVIAALVMRAPSLGLMRRIGWAPVVANALTTLNAEQKR